VEDLEVMGPLLARRPLRPSDARAADRDPEAVLGGELNGRLHLLGVGHVRRDEPCALAQLGGERLALRGADVGDRHARSALVEHA
jgi:hypothetical protein